MAYTCHLAVFQGPFLTLHFSHSAPLHPVGLGHSAQHLSITRQGKQILPACSQSLSWTSVPCTSCIPNVSTCFTVDQDAGHGKGGHYSSVAWGLLYHEGPTICLMQGGVHTYSLAPEEEVNPSCLLLESEDNVLLIVKENLPRISFYQTVKGTETKGSVTVGYLPISRY